MVRMALLLSLLAGCLLGPGPDAAWAHDPGLSMADFRLGPQQFTGHLTFARRDIDLLVPIDADQDGIATAAEFAAAAAPLTALVPQTLALRLDGQLLAGQITALELDQSDALHLQLLYVLPEGQKLRVTVPILAQLPRGHRQYASVRTMPGTLIAERLLDHEHHTFDLTLEATPPAPPSVQSFRQFLLLGVEHIVTGYDHILFLFGLLVIGGSFWSAGKIITSFTAAHSITLALATLNILQFPSHLVEPLIAVSIIYVGLENLWRRDLPHRWRLTFGFGLIHGLGFASVLRDLGMGGREALVPLLAFNGGVELGQLAIALLLVPLMGSFQKLPQFFPRFTTSCSVLVSLAGLYWLLQRTVFL